MLPITDFSQNPPAVNARERAPRGQVLVIFAALLTILLGMTAIVIDLAWIFSNQLQVQRAADAAALAGVVNLPGRVDLAVADALAEAQKNRYTNGTGGVVVTPRQDPDNVRRMLVTVSAPVDTFFMGLWGWSEVTVTRTSRADFVRPVPMGSPLNYYGVGDFRAPVPGPPTNGGTRAPTATHAPNSWTTPNEALVDGGTTHANNATHANQGYSNFNFPAIPAGRTITGIQVRVDARSADASPFGCAIGVALSWNNGAAGSYTTQKTQTLTDTFATYQLGSPTDTWGRTWTDAELSNAQFVARVRDVDPGSACTDTARTDLDFITVTVYYTGVGATQSREILAPDGSPLCTDPVTCSQGFWGAIEGQGSSRSTGDAYATGRDGAGVNAEYDPLGYDYTIEMPSGGTIYIFDPTFCATSKPVGLGHYGAGDHWLGDANAVSTYFRLWNTNGSALRSQHTLMPTSGDTLFVNEFQADLVTDIAVPPQGYSDAGEPANPPNCAEGAITNPAVGGYWHNKWWPMATVGAGTYRIQVTTTSQVAGQGNANADESFENMWSILADGGGEPHIYGSGRMVSYANIEGGQQEFYLAQIDRPAGAGKTVEIRLFDPGDVGAKAWMQILSPDGNSYDPVPFSYTADNGRSGTNVTCIQTYGGGSGPAPPAGCPNLTSGGTLYQNSWITINVPLDANYGVGGLQPSGETESGWWKIRYTVTSGNDTTTWEVSIRGNPVRLVVP